MMSFLMPVAGLDADDQPHPRRDACALILFCGGRVASLGIPAMLQRVSLARIPKGTAYVANRPSGI